MELTKQITDFFNQQGSKQRLRMLLALELDVSFETVSRWLNRETRQYQRAQCLNETYRAF